MYNHDRVRSTACALNTLTFFPDGAGLSMASREVPFTLFGSAKVRSTSIERPGFGASVVILLPRVMC